MPDIARNNKRIAKNTVMLYIRMIFVMLVLTRASISRIVEVLDENPDISDKPGVVSGAVLDGSVDFDQVSFSYTGTHDNPVLSNISIHIPAGTTVGIIGGTGSSKSTLVQLIPRLYDVTAGTVKVGGIDVRDLPLDVLRNSVAMVLQKNVLFSGTITENLRWGDENASDEELRAACRAADADGFIQSFPDGYNTVLGQGGVNLSGGQKQRLCIARALLKKPKILILDDSTSAVDTAIIALVYGRYMKTPTVTVMMKARFSGLIFIFLKIGYITGAVTTMVDALCPSRVVSILMIVAATKARITLPLHFFTIAFTIGSKAPTSFIMKK